MSVLKVDAVDNHFIDDKPSLKKGRDAVASGHLMECRVDRTLGLLFGIVQASQRTRSYTVKAFFTLTKISHAECSCPIGEHGLCHHIAAVLQYASTEISCTETKCQWSFKTKAGHGNEGLSIDVFYPHVFDTQTRVIVPSVDDVISSEGFKSCENKLQYFLDFFSFSQMDIESIANATKEQNNSALWHSIRRHRVTASVFGKAIGASSNNRSCESLFKMISGTSSPLEGIKAIDWGRTHEHSAVEVFSDNFPDKVISKTGIWLDLYGITGASPDRLCSSDEILEVKCPYSLRNASNLKQELAGEKCKKYFISIDKDGDFTIDTNHDYFHQVQGQLYLTKRTKCHFIIWIPKDMLVVTIEKQSDWSEKYMPCIYNFFFNRYVPRFFNS